MHLFFDTVWKLHIGEIPEKRFDVRKFSEGIEKYNQEIAAIKQNALTVLNPEIGIVESSCGTKCMIDGYVGWDRVPLHTPIQPDKFYKWIGGYETKEIPGSDEFGDYTKTVAILTLPEEKTLEEMDNDCANAAKKLIQSAKSINIKVVPEEKKNTIENMTIVSKLKNIQPDFDKKESYQHGFHDGVGVAIDMIETASGSVAAPKEEPMIIQKSIIPFLLGEDSYDGYWWDQKPIDKRPPFWWRTKLREEVEPITDLQINNAALETELTSLRQQLKEREEALKELLPIAERKFKGISIDDAASHREYIALKAIIERARNLLSK